MRLLVLLGAQQVPIWQDSRFNLALTGMILAGVLLLGALVIAWASKSWKEGRKGGFCSPEEQLTEFRKMLDLGEISFEEFEKVKQKLGKKISLKALPQQEAPTKDSPVVPSDSSPPPSPDSAPKPDEGNNS